MPQTEQITIKKIGRKQLPSKFKPGETFTITTVLDEKGRKLAAMGSWGENWKVGDVIEATVEEKKWTDRDGFEQTGLNLKDPNAKAFTPRGGFNPTLTLYQIAAQLAPLLFGDKKKVKLDDIDKLVEELKKRTNVSTPEEPKDKTPNVDVDEEDSKGDTSSDDDEVEEDENEEEPF